jgi:Protein of unknown function (DUF3396)
VAFDVEALSHNVRQIGDLAHLTIEDDRGNPSLRFGFVLKLYVKDAHETSVRERLIKLVAAYGALFGDMITHSMPYEGSRLKPVKDFDYIAYFRNHMLGLSPDDSEGFDAELYGFPNAVDRDEPTAIHIGVTAGPAIDLKRLGNTTNALGRLEAYFPADWLTNDYALYHDILLQWAEIGRPIHGSFGLGLIMEEGCSRGPSMPLAYPFLKRFVGLEYPDLDTWVTMSEDSTSPTIRSTNWLTFIDTPRAEALGGEKAIRSEVEPTCTVRAYDGGLVIQAGPEPQLGDATKGDIPAPYRTVARALRPLRFEDFGRNGIFNGLPSPLVDRDETLRWLRRFD